MAGADTKAPKKRIYLNFFDHGCTGSHMSPGQWRSVPSVPIVSVCSLLLTN
jgi:hypothetical protein